MKNILANILRAAAGSSDQDNRRPNTQARGSVHKGHIAICITFNNHIAIYSCIRHNVEYYIAIQYMRDTLANISQAACPKLVQLSLRWRPVVTDQAEHGPVEHSSMPKISQSDEQLRRGALPRPGSSTAEPAECGKIKH